MAPPCASGVSAVGGLPACGDLGFSKRARRGDGPTSQGRAGAQEQLAGRSLECTFFIHEQALHLPVGGHEAHVGQVHHLLLMAIRTNVTIRIVPTAVGAHAGVNEAFTRLTFPTYEPLIFLEHESSTLIEEAKAAVEAYQEIVGSLDRASLDGEQSKAVLVQLGERLSAVDSSGHTRLLPDALAVGVSFPGGHKL